MGRSPLLYFRLPSISILRIAVISLCKLFWTGFYEKLNVLTSGKANNEYKLYIVGLTISNNKSSYINYFLTTFKFGFMTIGYYKVFICKIIPCA